MDVFSYEPAIAYHTSSLVSLASSMTPLNQGLVVSYDFYPITLFQTSVLASSGSAEIALSVPTLYLLLEVVSTALVISGGTIATLGLIDKLFGKLIRERK